MEIWYAISFRLNVGYATEKLAETFLHKTHHILHYENLKLYLKYGLKLEQHHWVVEFQQSKWLGAYNGKNRTLQKQASNDFQK